MEHIPIDFDDPMVQVRWIHPQDYDPRGVFENKLLNWVCMSDWNEEENNDLMEMLMAYPNICKHHHKVYQFIQDVHTTYGVHVAYVDIWGPAKIPYRVVCGPVPRVDISFWAAKPHVIKSFK